MVSDDDRARAKNESKNVAELSEISVDLAPNRIEFSIRFDLMPIARLTSGLKSGTLVSGVRLFSLATWSS